MYWFDAIFTRNFPYVIRHQNAALGNFAKQTKWLLHISRKSGISDVIDPGTSPQIFT